MKLFNVLPEKERNMVYIINFNNMDSFKDIQKLQELFDASKSALIIPVVFSFACGAIEAIEVLPFNKFKSIRENFIYKELVGLFVDGYKFYFIGAVSVAMFAHYISPAILLYIMLVLYVVFYKLALVHRREHLKMGYTECALLLLMGLYLLLCILEISF